MLIYIFCDLFGDGSFSLIEEGQIFIKLLIDVFFFCGGVGVEIDFMFVLFGVGVYLDIEQWIGLGRNVESIFELEFIVK